MFFLKDDSVLEMINEGLRGLWANLCEFIYPKIAEMYSVFMDLSKLIYSDDLSAIYNKISLFLGIFMIFRLSFWLIEALMNPDILGDKAKAPGEMIKKVFLVVVLLGITPSLFKYAYKLQYEVVNSNVIGNIISDNKTVKPETKEFGKILSADLFSIFYRPNYDEAGNMLSAENLDCSIYTGTSDNNYEGYYYTILKNSGDLKYLSENRCLREKVEVEFTDTKEKVDVFVVDFDGLYATAVGIFVFWMILMYCISLGTRYVQLIFLQVISPIPIMGYLSTDKDNMFSKWVKQCTTTYLDVFIRIIIINFTVWLISMVLSGNSAIPSDLKKGGMITLFLVLGLLTFAKKAPELIQELLPKSVTKASGDFGLSWKKRTDAMLGGNLINGAVKRAPGYVAGGVVGGLVGGAMGIAGGKGVGSRIMGGITGLGRGLKTGTQKGSIIKNIGDVKKNQAARNNTLQQWRISAGKEPGEANTFGDWFERVKNKGRKAMGFETTGEYLKRVTDDATTTFGTAKDARDWHLEKRKKANGKTGYVTRKDKIGIATLENAWQRADEQFKTTDFGNLANTEAGVNQLKDKFRELYISDSANRQACEATIKASNPGIKEDKLKELVDTTLGSQFDASPFDAKSLVGTSLAQKAAELFKEDADNEVARARSAYNKSEDEASFADFLSRLITGEEKATNELGAFNKFLADYDDELFLSEGGVLDGEEVRGLGITHFDATALTEAFEKVTESDLDIRLGNEEVSYEKLMEAMSSKDTAEAAEAQKAYDELMKKDAKTMEAYATYYAGYKSWVGFKPLKERVTLVKASKEFARATANDKFNPGSGK